jgi:uncharacterized membrane protein
MVMADIERSIDVGVPLDLVYDELADIESFPHFMDDVAEVRRNPDGSYTWRADVDGEERTWDEVVVEAAHHERIVWRSASGGRNAGEITLLPLDDTTTTVTMRIDYQPEGLGERLGAALGADERRVERHLESFKRMVEQKHAGSGWHDPRGI